MKPVRILLVILVVQNLIFIVGGSIVMVKVSSINIPDINIPDINLPMNRLKELINFIDERELLNRTNELVTNMNSYYEGCVCDDLG